MPREYGKSGNINAAADTEEEFLDEGTPGRGNIGNRDRLAQTAGNQDEEQEDFSQHDTQFENIVYALRTSKKGGFSLRGNSKRFKAVDDALEKLLDLMDMRLDPADSISTGKILLDTLKTYNILIDACERYVDNRDVRTGSGMRRRTIVNHLKDMAKKDIRGFLSYFDQHSTLPQEQRARSVKEVLSKSRRRVIQLNTNESDLKHVGGAVSYIAVINEDDTEAGGKASGFFKEEDILTRMATKDQLMQLAEMISKRKKWPKGVYEEVKERLGNALNKDKSNQTYLKGAILSLQGEQKYLSDIAYHNFVDDLFKAAGSHQTTMDTMEKNYGLGAIGDELGDSVNMSSRNVAASRLAEMLGVGDLIAHSETAELHGKDGTVKKGNLMQKARGVEFAQAMQMITKEDYDKGNYAKNPESVKGLKGSMTPQFVKSLTSLQVLDNLMGQIDRHIHNYFVELGADNKLGRVQGIDNDFGFGHTISMEYGTYESKNILTKDMWKIKSEDEAELNLRYMDKTLADNILGMKEADARMMFCDVLEQGAIDTFCLRLSLIQAAIRRAQAGKTNSVKFMERDEDWASDEIYESYYNKDARDQATYVGVAMANALTDSMTPASARALNHDIEAETEVKKEWMKHAGSLNEAVIYIDSLNNLQNNDKIYCKVVLEDIWKKDPDSGRFKENSCDILNIPNLQVAIKDTVYGNINTWER